MYCNLVSLKENGVSLNRSVTARKSKKACSTVVSKRGNVTTFSRSSCRRLRKFLLNYIGDGLAYGLTCTIPFTDLSDKDFRDLVARFRKNVTRMGHGLIYRIELQQNKMPHLHCVGYATSNDVIFDCQFAWWQALSTIMYNDEKYGEIPLICRDGVLLYSCNISRPSSNFHRWFAYLSCHASKHKYSQLGFQGRQWGVINKQYFKLCKSDDIALDDSEYFRLLRWIRRLTRCKSKRGLYGVTDWFVNPGTIKRMVDYIACVPF